MNKKYLAFFALVACLTGCVPLDSLKPLYTNKDIVFDKSLLGDWAAINKEDEGATLSFGRLIENGEETGYSMIMSGKNNDGTCTSMEFFGHEIEIAGNKYLDLVVLNWDARDQAYPLQISQSKNGTVITPALLRLGIASYMEFNAANR